MRRTEMKTEKKDRSQPSKLWNKVASRAARKVRATSGKPGGGYKPSKSQISSDFILVSTKTLRDLKEKKETKEAVPLFRGLDSPTLLKLPHPGYTLTDTKESVALGTALSRMFSGKWYEFRVTTALNMSSSGTGLVNSVVANSAINSTGDFSALSGVFSEFFIKTMKVTWEPVSMYNYPLTGVSTSSVSSLPIGVSDLQHAQAAYTSMTAATENWRYQHKNTGRAFTFSWINSEKPTSTVAVDASTGVNSQSWADVRDAGTYTGTIQFISQSPPPALPVTQVLGTFLVEWDVLFRVRL